MGEINLPTDAILTFQHFYNLSFQKFELSKCLNLSTEEVDTWIIVNLETSSESSAAYLGLLFERLHGLGLSLS